MRASPIIMEDLHGQILILDASEHQGEWIPTPEAIEKLRKYGGIILRGGYGGYSGKPATDAYFERNYTLLRTHCPWLKIYVYWYYSNRCSWVEQKDHALKIVAGKVIYGFAVDVERNKIWVALESVRPGDEIFEVRNGKALVYDNTPFTPADYKNIQLFSVTIHDVIKVAEFLYSNCSILRDMWKYVKEWMQTALIWAAYPVDDYPDYLPGFDTNKNDLAYLPGIKVILWQRLWRLHARPLGWKSAYMDENTVMIPATEFAALTSRATSESSGQKTRQLIHKFTGWKPRILLDGVQEMPHIRVENTAQNSPETPQEASGAISSTNVLNIPYHSQISDVGAQMYHGDCGMTCVRMLLDAYGEAEGVTIDQLHKAMGRGAGWAWVSDLQNALARYGIPSTNKYQNWIQNNVNPDIEWLERWIDDGQPTIALIDYEFIEHLNPYDGHFTGQHFVLVVGYDDDHIILHDPLWEGDKGAYWPVPRELFARAWKFTDSPHAYLLMAVPVEG